MNLMILLNAVAKTEISIDFNRFISSLPYVGYGMLGIFMVIGVIMIATILLIAVENKIKAKKAKKQEFKEE
ncbi:MAG: hypothetical protein J6Q38_02610 [Clostridia bacterium]|nr:hypothetical protein [Clostridia bacterium]